MKKYKINLQLFLVLALLFTCTSYVFASEVTGTLSSSNASSSEGSTNGGSTGTINGTVSGGSSASGSSSNSGSSSGSSVLQNQSSSVGNSDQAGFVSSDGTALSPSSSNLAFADYDDASSYDSLATDDIGEETIITTEESLWGESVSAQAISASPDLSTSTWILITLATLLLITITGYVYVRNTAGISAKQAF